MESILKYFPMNIYKILQEIINQNIKIDILSNAIEIRVRLNRPIIIRLRNIDIIAKYKITEKDMLYIMEKICENSLYAYKEQICQGFITIKGGHRVGITGTCVIENEKICNIKYITGLNFRIAREIKDVAIPFLKEVIDIKNNTIFTTLIVSPPGGGKTTVLRDLIRIISNGMPEIGFKAKTCGVVDERGEIAASYKGIPQNDLGELTDVIENVPKDIGMRILIRSMAPEIIACDEIGTQEDYKAIKYAVNSGVKGIFTYHAKNIDEVMRNEKIKELANDNVIEKIIVLDMEKKGQIKEVR